MYRSPPLAPLFDVMQDDPLQQGRRAFARSGGLLPADGLAQRVTSAHGQGIGMVARWIVERAVISLHWQGSYWIPAFQFCPATWRPQAALANLLAELPPPTDRWTWTEWFAEPNDVLRGERPADRWALAPEEVRQAARLLRFVRNG